MNNEKYVKQSMEPDDLWVSINGRSGNNSEPFDLVGNGDRIIMNILILSYKRPITISELSEKIGIPCAYLEKIVEDLIRGQLMKRIQNKIYTDFIIYSTKEMYMNFKNEKKYAEEIYEEVLDVILSFYSKIDSNILRTDSLLSYFALKTITSSMYDVRDEIAGHIAFEDYPDRPNNGKWHATGYHYPSGFDYENDIKKDYMISGESYNEYDEKEGKGTISVCEYDTELGKTRGHWRELTGKNNNDCVKEFLKIMYLCHGGDEKELFNKYGMVVNHKALEKINVLVEGGFLTEDKKVKINILNRLEYENIIMCIRECKEELIKRFGNIFKIIYEKNYVEVPKHLLSVPEYLKYMSEVNLPMMIILKGKENRKIFKDSEGKVPAVIIVKSDSY